ncbi:hypothetical protein RAS1_07720 [Phycisphaerae bacterium RAS1]|nr:hypothetical protein RAS1_07720 [Phycisphaerae bacterium RAS1]
MEQQTYARRKSRIIIHGADRWAPALRTVGQIVIAGPKWKQPVILKGGYTLTVFKSRNQDLRKALIRFHRDPLGSFWKVFGLLASFGLGAAVMRNFYEFVILR